MFGSSKANRNTRKNLQHRLLAWLMALAMLMGLSGVTALAEGSAEIPAEPVQAQETAAPAAPEAVEVPAEPAPAADLQPEESDPEPTAASEAETPAAESGAETPAAEPADDTPAAEPETQTPAVQPEDETPAAEPETADTAQPETEPAAPQAAEPVTVRGYALLVPAEGEEDVRVSVYTTETALTEKGTLKAGAVVKAARTEGVRRLYISFYADGEPWFGYVEPEAFAFLTEEETAAFEAASEALAVVDHRGRSFYDMSAFFTRNADLYPKAEQETVTPEPETPDVSEPVAEPVEEAAAPVPESVEETAAPVEETVEEAAEPVAESVEETAAPVEESVEETAAPVTESVEEAAAPVAESVEEAAAPVAETVEEETPAVEADVEPVTLDEAIPEEILPEEPAPAVSEEAVAEIEEPADDIEPLDVLTADAEGDTEPETVSFTGTLLWTDDDDRDGLRPESVAVYLGRSTQSNASIYKVSGSEATVTEADGWAHTWTGLAVANAAGEAYKYHLYETTPAGYTRSYPSTDHKVLRNRHEPETQKITVTKVWDDGSDQQKLRPGTVSITLLADGKTAAVQRLSGSGDKWTYTFRDLYKYRDHGTEIAYSVSEMEVPEYTSEIAGSVAEGFTITNTHEIERISISVTKVWNDSYDYDKVRPESVTIKLKANNRETGDTLVLTKADATTSSTKWAGTFENLPKYDADMNEIVYSVTEVKVQAYSFKVSGDMATGFTVTNKHTKGTGLTTGDEIPAWPFISAGAGVLALAAALFLGRKRKPCA